MAADATTNIEAEVTRS